MGQQPQEERREMLTPEEAINAFRDAGLSEHTFRKRVKEGMIEKILPEGRTRGTDLRIYQKTKVIKAIAEITKGKPGKPRRKILHETLPPTHFLLAGSDDMPGIAALLLTLYGRISIEKRRAWIERNPDMCYILRSQGKVVGCAFLMPLAEEKILEILSQDVKPPTRPSEILLYEPGQPVHLYIRSIAVLQHEGISVKQRRYWWARLILGISKVIVGLGTRGVRVEKIYCVTDSASSKRDEQGMRRLGFTQITSTTKYKNFVIDLATSGLDIALRYKEALDHWRIQNEEE